METHPFFGTDGIRGTANQYPITPEGAVSIGRSLVRALQRQQPNKNPLQILIGRDTRISGLMLEHALASSLCSEGSDVLLLGVLPTPAVSYLTRFMKADAGIMITASHNPYLDNGIKIFSKDGLKLNDHMEAEIECEIKKNLKHIHSNYFDPDIAHLGNSRAADRFHKKYTNYLTTLFKDKIDLSSWRITLDCAHGAAINSAAQTLKKLGAGLFCIGRDPNGININQNCGALCTAAASKLTLESQSHLGIVLDGDGDRCILIDERGEMLNGDQILGLCALDMNRENKLPGRAVVATHLSNMGLELALQSNGIRLLRSKVGDKYVLNALMENNLILGGEQSGHLLFLDALWTGDGILTALKVLEIMNKTNRSLSELKKEIPLLPQVHESIPVRRKEPFENILEVKNAINLTTSTLGSKGRVLVRYSGTEPIARVMVEGEHLGTIKDLSQKIAQSIQSHLGQSNLGSSPNMA